MSQVIGAAVGIVIGCIVGLLKNVFVWGGYLKSRESGENSTKEQNAIMKRSIISYLVCLGVLLVIYLLRNVLPFSWIWCLVATGLCISIMNITIVMKKKIKY